MRRALRGYWSWLLGLGLACGGFACGARTGLPVDTRDRGPGEGEPCVGGQCTTPPPPQCASATTVRSHEDQGTCTAGTCSYAFTDTECPLGCSGGRCNDTTLPRVISAGIQFTCTVIAGGGVKCWGSNSSGQLGNGTTTDTYAPGYVVGLSSGVFTVSAGAFHACAVTVAGAVKCWGQNDSGQLGDGAEGVGEVPQAPVTTPVDVVGLSSGIVAVSAGGAHTCALTAAGAVKCWGNTKALGNGAAAGSSVPVDVVGLSADVVALSAGAYGTCAVTSAGALQCWGINYIGLDGAGPTSTSLVPVEMPGAASGVVDVSVGMYHTCFTTASGGIKCWGLNGTGALGNPLANESALPLDVTGLSSGMVAVSAGDAQTVALSAKGAVKFWGSKGGSPDDSSPVPVDMPGLSAGVVAVSSGDNAHSCALLSTGSAMCWGLNTVGALGRDPMSLFFSDVPVEVEGL